MQKEIDILVSLLKEALLEIQKLKTRLDQYEKPEDGYIKSSSWITKIVFIIKKAGKPLRSSEIITLLNAREPVLNEKVSKEKFLSPFLNIAMKYKRLIPFKIKGVRGNYLCLPEWIDENNQLLPEMRKQIA